MATKREGSTPVPGDATPEVARLYRRRSGRVVAGVAGGLAEHLGVNVLWVRAGFIVLAGLAGAGASIYGLLWAFVPLRKDDPGRALSPKERQQAVGLVALGLGFAVAAGAIGGSWTSWVTGPLGVALVGAAVVWREADEAQRRRWRDGTRSGVSELLLGGGSGRTALLRILAGTSLVIAGIAVFLITSVNVSYVQFALLAVLATLAGVAVLTVPWWVRLVRDLGEERKARIRAAERAEIAAHLHDSVLQTLALIQKQAETPREVRRLARGQERQLRTWLYGPSGDGGTAAQGGTFEDPAGEGPSMLSEAIAQACGAVEDTFAITVQQVVVGDCPLDERLNALVHATREAVVNAAKHAGVSEVSVYAEVEPARVHVFVRDRGKGFDPDTVPADRHGLANSIRGRMERHGGEVVLRTALGEGTEIQLHVPRDDTRARGTTVQATASPSAAQSTARPSVAQSMARPSVREAGA